MPAIFLARPEVVLLEGEFVAKRKDLLVNRPNLRVEITDSCFKIVDVF